MIQCVVHLMLEAGNSGVTGVELTSEGAFGIVAGRQNEHQTPLGTKTFQAKVTKSFPNGYTVETVIDGKRLRGLLFSTKPRPEQTPCNDSIRCMMI